MDRGVALEAAGQKPHSRCSELAHSKCSNHFPELLVRVGGLHEMHTHPGFLRARNQSVIACEEDAVAVLGVVHELLITQVPTRQIRRSAFGIKARKSQMTAEPPQVFVDQKTEGAQ